MPELPVVGDAPSKAASGAGGLVTKRIGPLPLWAWVGAAGLAVLALRLSGRISGGRASVTGAGVAVAPARTIAATAGDASGVGTISAPPPPPRQTNIIDPTARPPVAVSDSSGPPKPGMTTAIIVPHSGIGATPNSTSFTAGRTVSVPWTAPPTATDIPASQFGPLHGHDVGPTEINPPASRPNVGYMQQPDNSDNPNIDRRG